MIRRAWWRFWYNLARKDFEDYQGQPAGNAWDVAVARGLLVRMEWFKRKYVASL